MNAFQKSFRIQSLEFNLLHGRGSDVQLSRVPSKIKIGMGSDSCPYRSSVSFFYVNELARMAYRYPSIDKWFLFHKVS